MTGLPWARTLTPADRQPRPATGGLAAGELPWPVAIYLLCLVIPVWFTLGSLFLSTLRLVLLVVTLPMLAGLLTGRHGRLLPCDLLFLAHLAWAGVALARNSPADVAQQMGSFGVELLGGYLVARTCIRTPETFLALARALVALTVLMLPLAVVEALTYRVPVVEALHLLGQWALPGLTSVDLIRYPQRLGLYRAQVVFPHPILFGLYAAMIFPLAFVALKGAIPAPRRWVLAGMVGTACVLSLSSGAILAMALQLGLIGWAAALAGLRWRWRLLAALFAAAWLAIDLLSDRSPLRVFMSYATFSPHNAYFRGMIFEWGMVNVRANPVFGLGMRDWVRPAVMHGSSVDNFWLLMAMRYGVPGLLFLAAGFGWGLWRMARLRLDDPVRAQIRRAWMFTFLGLFFALATVHVWSSVYSFAFFLFGSGLWLIAPPPPPAPRRRLPLSRFAPVHRRLPEEPA